MTEERVVVGTLHQQDLPFLLALWRAPGVMTYADELPWLRGWTRHDDPLTAWATYREQRAALGVGYVQLIIRLGDGEPIGESFFAPLPEGYTFGRWKKPPKTICLMGDIKLHPDYWGRGLGTEGMQRVVAWLLANTECSLLIVPPHRNNPAAERVYEKAGFELFTGCAATEIIGSWR